MKIILIILLYSLAIKSESNSEQLLNHSNNEPSKEIELTKKIDEPEELNEDENKDNEEQYIMDEPKKDKNNPENEILFQEEGLNFE